ncbi:MAG: ribonuclease-3 [Parvicella sp.]|jgi:ribonuclease-3
MIKFLLFGKKLSPEEKQISDYIYQTFGRKPRRMELFEKALTHKSILIDKKRANIDNNERLEFLGDAIISSAVADILYEKFPEASEGHLTQMRARVVSRQNLNAIGLDLNFEHLIRYQKTSHPFKSLLGNTFESLVGAMHVDFGYDKTFLILRDKVFANSMDFDKIVEEDNDYKSQLIIYCQRNKYEINFECINEYRVESGENVYQMAVVINDELIYQIKGKTKRKAEQKACEIVLSEIDTVSVEIEERIKNQSKK